MVIKDQNTVDWERGRVISGLNGIAGTEIEPGTDG